MSDDLKPCPFCGSTITEAAPDARAPYWMTCRNCDASGPYDASDTITAWNTRPAEDALRADLAAARAEAEALRAELREIKDQRDEDRLRRDPGVCY